MTFEAVRTRVSAMDAARRLGMSFGRNRRALCPWHNDTYPDLAFYNDGQRCYCHACHNGGDSIALAAQVLGVRPLEAAQWLASEFSLGSVEVMTNYDKPKQPKNTHKEAIHEMSKKLDRATQIEAAADNYLKTKGFAADDSSWDNPKFINALLARSLAFEQCEQIISLTAREIDDIYREGRTDEY